MAGAHSAHGQFNKPHKRGKHAGASARTKHKLQKEGLRQGVRKAANAVVTGKLQRQNTAKQLRENKKAEVLSEKRRERAPPVVALLPLSQAVDAQQLWNLILGAFLPPVSPTKHGKGEAMEEDTTPGAHPMVPTLVAVPGKSRQRFVLTPPPPDRTDLLSIVDLGKAAEVLLLVMPGESGAACLDADGQQALSLLRQLGMPSVIGVASGTSPDQGGNAAAKMKGKAAARKRAAAVLAAELSGDNKVVTVDDESDCQQLIRALQDINAPPPQWRRQRPQLLLDAAQCHPLDADKGTLTLRGCVRNLGLSANQVLHIPGAGDFQIKQMQVLEQPAAHGTSRKEGPRDNADSASAMEVAAPQQHILPDMELQEPLVRENEADDLIGEQTWPTDKEMAEAEEAAKRKRRVPKGTSAYQAAWIVDDEGSGDEGADDYEELVEYASDQEHPHTPGTIADSEFGGMTEFADAETDAMEKDEESMKAAQIVDLKRRWREQQDDVLFPDEMDTPADIAARTRFAKFRGLRSWRSSPWDPKENLPREYARVFAFQAPTRAQRRARALAEAAGKAGDPHSVPAGTYLEVHVADVPTAAAAAVVQRVSDTLQGKALPLSVFGLLQHETKLSVVNFSVRKALAFEGPLPNKAELLLMTGVRSFTARPILSSDEPNTTRFKMERFLHAGRQTMMTVYAPIAFGPLPVLAFQRNPDGQLRLVASGSLRSCNPDRIVLKKVVLSGYPVKVQKKKAVVRWMFHSPEDIRWFRPVDLWTKHGRRGQITEPVGTHGSMKCLFDAPVKQQDSVCLSLYKRAFPKWPDDLSFS